MVKHLSSKDSSDGSENGECFNDVSCHTPKQTPPQHKKQVRRRLHTTKPYQERLLNMAEARREIVTALKFHRASMKQQEAAAATATTAAAADNHQYYSPPPSSFGQERRPKSRSIHSLYPPATSNATANSYWPMSTLAPPLPPPPLPPPSYHDNHDLVLPSQPLGLNLNYQSFTNLDTNIYHKPFPTYSSSSTSSSTPSSTSSPALSTPAGNSTSSTDLHHAMDGSDVVEEIKSLADQHQMEWNDRINLVTSARWCNILKTMKNEDDECYHGLHQFDQKMEFPPWLINGNESSCLQQHFNDHFSDSHFQDHALPCMDIGEIEAMDGEWLA